jgi:prevent-host-death family protein
MPRIVLNKDIHSLSDFRSNVSGFINKVHETKRPIVITQHGRSSAVLIDVSEYERMIDKFELIKDIEIASRQISEGQGIDHSKVIKKLKNRYK